MMKNNQCFTEASFEYVKIFNETSKVPAHAAVKLIRRSQSFPAVFADIEITDNLEKYDMKLRILISSLGNNRYRLSPFGIPRKPVCSVLNNEYRHIAMREYHKYSNFPFSEDRSVDLCDLMPVGHYYFRNYSIDPATLHRLAPTARYNLQFLFYKKGEKSVVKIVELHALLT